MNDSVLREQLVLLLTGEHAHVSAERALAGLEPRLRGARPAPGLHSVFEELEHMRIAQQDILRYTLDAGWRSPKFPDGYWPPPDEPVGDARWEASVSGFRSDLDDEVCVLARNPAVDLTALVPHGEWRTYLRQILLVADHNAYHAGQIVQSRKALRAWQSRG
jgi:hypothetical protein